MSHGSHEEHARRLAETRAAAKAIGKTIGLLADLQGNKGINLPGVAVNVPALSEKDEDDLRFALRNNFDLIALSFVRNASDVTRVREVMAEEGLTLPVIAKIEKPQAFENLDEIIAAFDAFMVVRGDLGVELPLEFVPMGAEGHHLQGPHQGEAGDRGHADARLHDRFAHPDARRDVRCRQCHLGRRRRGHVVGRNVDWRLPGEDRGDDGADHRKDRGPGRRPSRRGFR